MTCAEVNGTTTLSAVIAVGVTTLVMHLLRCVHPPGGATALVAVLGGEAVTSMHYSFVWHSVMVDALTLVVVAVLFNNLFRWRRHPAGLDHARVVATTAGQSVTHARVVAALREIDSFVDITEDNLVRLVDLLGRPGAE